MFLNAVSDIYCSFNIPKNWGHSVYSGFYIAILPNIIFPKAKCYFMWFISPYVEQSFIY